MLIAGYIISMLVDVNVGGFKLMMPAFGITILVIAGSYLLFKNFIPMLIEILKYNDAIYYKISNFISISQIAYRVKANAKMFCVISVLCATTIIMISGSYSLYKGLEDAVNFYAPYSYLCKGITDKEQQEILDITKEVGDVNVTYNDKIKLINGEMKDNSYKSSRNKNTYNNTNCYILSESIYKTIIKHTDAKKGSFNNLKTDFEGNLKDNECYFIDCNTTSDYCKDMKGSKLDLSFKYISSKYKVKDVSIHKYIGMVDNYKKATVVVSDKAYNKFFSIANDKDDIDYFYGFIFDKEMESSKTVKAINKIIKARTNYQRMPENISYIEFYKTNFQIYGSYVFIGLFIAILFMLAVASILYYKLIIEAEEEKSRYQILRKVGMKKREILLSIAKQLSMVYGFPLVIGLLDTYFALLTYNRALDVIGQDMPTFWNSMMVVSIYVATYGAFYLLSVFNYYKIVQNKKTV